MGIPIYSRTVKACLLELILVAVAMGSIHANTIVIEPPGPCSRKTPFVISEIMYNAATITVGSNNLSTEFIELYNSNPFYEDLSGYKIGGDIDFTFPKGVGLAGLSRLVLAKKTNEFQAYYNLSGVTLLQYGVTNNVTNIVNSLSRSGTLQLINNAGGVVLDFTYDNDNPWPVGADGTGHSFVLARPSYGANDPQAWSISDHVGGSPGLNETYTNDVQRNVFINEILAHTDPPLLDTVELYNHGNSALDISGCILTDAATTNKHVIVNGTTIPARGYVIFDQTQLGFALSSGGETLYLWNSNHTRLLDVVQFGAQENGVSYGRHPDGAGELYRLTSRTLGTNNSDILVSSVVINEIMYDPITGSDNDEYVELFNRTNVPVNIGGWRLEDGVSFTIPTNTILAANSYLVIAKSLTNLLAKYPQLNSTNTLGNYNGSLKNSVERVALSLPDSTNGTNTIHIIVDEVTYRTGGQWPGWAHGGGSSLERRDTHADSRLASNWADSDETAKAPWTIVDVTGVLSLGGDVADGVEGGLQGEGECLIDDVEVVYSNLNRVANGTFNSNSTGWVFRGNHIRTALETANGFGGTRGLRLRASGRCDAGANRIRSALSTTIPNGATATIRVKARWQRGWPELLLRLHGNYLEASARLTVPGNLGTPGLVNSTAKTNAGPAIYNVSHSPVMPAASEAVVVTVQAHDPDGLFTLQLKYRVDPSTTVTTLNMVDTGSGGDVIAGDGVYSATIPGQLIDNIVAFVVTASDNSPAHVVSLFPTNGPANSPRARECLVRFGEPQRASSFGTYHQWFTTPSITAWVGRPVLSNEGIEGTFVYGDYRAIYNFESHYAGSPYHQGWTTPEEDCHYSMTMPRDDLVLGTDNFNKIHAPGDDPFSDGFLACEQTAHWVARQIGLPWTNRRFVNMYVNGGHRKLDFLMEDTEVPGSDVVETYFPNDSNGELHKAAGWFEMTDAPTGALPINLISWATLNSFQEPEGSGNHKLARYRWNWPGRSSSSTGNDYTNLFRLMDAASTPDGVAFGKNMEAEADMEQWMRLWAARHACGDWDFFGNLNSQNSYAYRPDKGRWQLFSWDMNAVFSLKNTTFPTAPGMGLFPPPGQDWTAGTNLTKVFNHPAFRRMYWRSYKALCYGPLEATNFNAYVDSRYDAFIADDLSVTSPTNTFSFTDNLSLEYGTNVDFTGSIQSYVADARTVLLSRLATEDAVNFTVNDGTFFSTSSNLVTFSGVAPVEIKTITINGNPYPVTWLTASSWTMSVPLTVGTNVFLFQAWDVNGNQLTNFSQTITANYTGAYAAPEGAVIFNEIQPHPLVAGAEFVELFNRATNTFDLSGWRINGLDYTFPSGSFIKPLNYLVVAKDWYPYANTYGFTNPPFGFFNGNLNPDGETLTLFRPGVLPGDEIVVDRVRYESNFPWPSVTNGASLQLLDPAQDNSRVANWSITTTNAADFAPWVMCKATGIPRPTSTLRPLFVYLESDGDIYIDDVTMVAGSVAESGVNTITNGGFETLLTPWTLGSSGNNSASVVSTNYKHSGNSSLHLIAASAGSTQNTSIWQDFSSGLTVGGTYTLSFWFRQSTNGGPLTVRFSNSSITISTNPAPTEVLLIPIATPGAANSISNTLPPFPPVWLNEVQVANVTGAFDNFGERDPWAEIFNAGTNAFSLAGYYLTDTYTNLTKWAIPFTASVASSNFFVLWCDAQTNQSVISAPHTSFRLTNSFGQLALTRITNGGPQIVDYLNYTNLPSNWSYGDFPDGQPFYRQAMFKSTSGAANTNANPPLTVFINEWLADNLTTLADPADSQFEDWFEIYNPNTNIVDLGGYYLTDNLTNKFQFLVPTNGQYTIAPGGFLLVWADNEAGQNSTNRADLHASFSLAKSGEAIGIFSANGTMIDAVTFGAQMTDLSQGRFPDGGAGIFPMPTRTPRTNNIIPNTAPVFVTVGDKYTYAGLSVQFTAIATDAQSAVQSLSFSLLSGPGGATIHPTTGVFNWNVPLGTAPGTNLITARVLDSGTPPLSDDETFAVIIRPLPHLSSVVSGNQLQLTWPMTEMGWRLQAQTNALDVGLNANWFTVPNSTLTNQLSIPMNTTNGSVFFRLVSP